MPINYVGLGLVLLGLAFMIAEIFMPSFGALGLGGLIAFVIGSVMLFDYQTVNYSLAWSLIIGMSGLTAIFFLVMLNLAFQSHKKTIVTGVSGLIGLKGTVLSVQNHEIMVKIQGEIWRARCSVPLKPGDMVQVFGVEGLLLEVHRISENEQGVQS